MTLNTGVYVRDRIDPMEVFAKCRDLLGATPKIEARFYFERDGGEWSVGNKSGQGLPALLDIEFRPGEPLRTEEQSAACDTYCDDDCDGKWHRPACWLSLSFDTTYSYTDEHGGCGHLHARLLADLGEWLASRGVSWCWQNEFTGEYHESFEGLDELAGGGDTAREWFAERVVPAIEAAGGRVT